MSIISDFSAFKNRIVQKIKDNGSTDNSRTKGIDHRQIELDIADTLESLAIGGGLGAFSAVRTSSTPILSTEKRIQYDPTDAGDITPTLPTPTNGRQLWLYNVGTENNVIAENIKNYSGTLETVTIGPGDSPLGIVGDGTNWRNQ